MFWIATVRAIWDKDYLLVKADSEAEAFEKVAKEYRFDLLDAMTYIAIKKPEFDMAVDGVAFIVTVDL